MSSRLSLSLYAFVIGAYFAYALLAADALPLYSLNALSLGELVLFACIGLAPLLRWLFVFNRDRAARIHH